MNTKRYSSQKVFTSLFFLFSTLLILPSSSFAQDGEKLFKANCASCHRITDKDLTGPGLAGVMDRVPSKEWLYEWIKNSQKVIKSGDKYANDIYEKYNKTLMPPQAVSNEEIDAILEYVAAGPPPPPPGGDVAGGDPVPTTSGSPIMWILLIGVVLFIVLRVLLGVRRSLGKVIAERDGQEPQPEMDFLESLFHWLGKNKKITAVLIVLVVGYLGAIGWNSLMGIGIYQGYAPEQPIAFSHKIHAGENAINCVYCHSSAEKGKASGIPSVNVCMNCHVAIQEGKVTGTKEIAKIYEAAGWDPEKGKWDPNNPHNPQKPIEWVRVHNLPDFVYFNHSQHVVVGEQECQTCHGPVETMDVLRQHSDLTMGWCINCHRETNVVMEGNEYYEDIHKDLMEKYKDQGLDKFTVEHIGGLECAKCHY